MQMSKAKQQIHIFIEHENELFSKACNNIKEFQETVETLKKEHPAFDPIEDMTVIVGEKRAVCPKLMGASVRYDIQNTICKC